MKKALVFALIALMAVTSVFATGNGYDSCSRND